MTDKKSPCIVRYRKLIKPGYGIYVRDVCNYEQVGAAETCCDRMKDYLGQGAVGFGNSPEEKVSFRTGLRIYTAFAEFDEDISYTHFNINFCPGCGAVIQMIEVETVTLVRKEIESVTTKIVWEKPTGVQP